MIKKRSERTDLEGKNDFGRSLSERKQNNSLRVNNKKAGSEERRRRREGIGSGSGEFGHLGRRGGEQNSARPRVKRNTQLNIYSH